MRISLNFLLYLNMAIIGLLVSMATYLISINAPDFQKRTLFVLIFFSLITFTIILLVGRSKSGSQKMKEISESSLLRESNTVEKINDYNQLIKPLKDYHQFVDQKHWNSYTIVCAFMIVAFIIVSIGFFKEKDIVIYVGAITEITGMVIIYLINKTTDQDYHKLLVELQKIFMQRQLIEELSDESKKDDMRVELFNQLKKQIN